MSVLDISLIILGSLGLVFLGIYYMATYHSRRMRRQLKDWEPNDIILVKPTSEMFSIINQNKVNGKALLVRWNRKEVLIQQWGSDETKRYFLSFDEIEMNKSYEQRIKLASMKKFLTDMDKDPNHTITSIPYDTYSSTESDSPEQPESDIKPKSTIKSKNHHSSIQFFYDEYNISISNNTATIDKKPVSSMTETSLQIYLKLALEHEAFELAAIINREMERFS